MAARDLQRGERVQLGAAGLVGVSLLLPWYATDPANANASVDGRRGDILGWAAHPVLRWLCLAAVGAAVLSAWQTIAGRVPTPGVQRGEKSAVVALAGVALLLFQGWVVRPGYPTAEIDLAYGWFLALAGALVALGAATTRLPQAKRTPPGVDSRRTRPPRTSWKRRQRGLADFRSAQATRRTARTGKTLDVARILGDHDATSRTAEV